MTFAAATAAEPQGGRREVSREAFLVALSAAEARTERVQAFYSESVKGKTTVTGWWARDGQRFVLEYKLRLPKGGVETAVYVFDGEVERVLSVGSKTLRIGSPPTGTGAHLGPGNLFGLGLWVHGFRIGASGILDASKDWKVRRQAKPFRGFVAEGYIRFPKRPGSRRKFRLEFDLDHGLLLRRSCLWRPEGNPQYVVTEMIVNKFVRISRASGFRVKGGAP